MEAYKEKARAARLKVLEMIHRAGTSHIASNFSVIDIATVLYENLQTEDRVVWSKGWAAAAIYYFLAQQGHISVQDLDKFPNDPYLGLAETTVPGVLVNGGSVGHGLPVAVGVALAKKKAHKDGKVYCIMSDGELNEGTTWEAAMLANHHKLDNLVVIIDANGWQAMGKTIQVLNLEPIKDKFAAFGFSVLRIDGHDYSLLEKAIIDFKELTAGMPKALICDTIKGKGISFMENHLTFHYKHVSDEDYQKALAELV